MSTFVGRIQASPSVENAVAPGPKAEPKPSIGPKPEEKAEKTRAELVEEAEALGIAVPKRASKVQIQKLIDEAPVI